MLPCLLMELLGEQAKDSKRVLVVDVQIIKKLQKERFCVP